MKVDIEVVGEDRRGKAPGPRNITPTDEADIREFVKAFVELAIREERERIHAAYVDYVCKHGPPSRQDEWNALMSELFPGDG